MPMMGTLCVQSLEKIVWHPQEIWTQTCFYSIFIYEDHTHSLQTYAVVILAFTGYFQDVIRFFPNFAQMTYTSYTLVICRDVSWKLILDSFGSGTSSVIHTSVCIPCIRVATRRRHWRRLAINWHPRRSRFKYTYEYDRLGLERMWSGMQVRGIF